MATAKKKKITKKPVQKRIYFTLTVNGVDVNIDITPNIEDIAYEVVTDVLCDMNLNPLRKAVSAAIEKELGTSNTMTVTHLTNAALASLKKF